MVIRISIIIIKISCIGPSDKNKMVDHLQPHKYPHSTDQTTVHCSHNLQTSCKLCGHKDALHQPHNTLSLVTRFIIPRTWSSKVSLLSNFTQRMSRMALVKMETSDKTKSTWGGFIGQDGSARC